MKTQLDEYIEDLRRWLHAGDPKNMEYVANAIVLSERLQSDSDPQKEMWVEGCRYVVSQITEEQVYTIARKWLPDRSHWPAGSYPYPLEHPGGSPHLHEQRRLQIHGRPQECLDQRATEVIWSDAVGGLISRRAEMAAKRRIHMGEWDHHYLELGAEQIDKLLQHRAKGYEINYMVLDDIVKYFVEAVHSGIDDEMLQIALKSKTIEYCLKQRVATLKERLL